MAKRPKASSCQICTARAADSAYGVSLCRSCLSALSPLSDSEGDRLQAYVLTAPPNLQSALITSRATATIHPVSETLLDPRVPTPDVVLTYRHLGYSATEIADLFKISKTQVRRLITAGNREDLAETARDFIHLQFLPKVLANIDAALSKDSTARLSMDIADKLGLLTASAASRPPGGDESSTFEEYRLSILKRRTNDSKTQSQTVDATSVIDVSPNPEPEPAAIARLGPSRSGESDKDDGA